MKITVMHPTEVDAAAIRMALPVRYEEEDMPNDYPHRKGESWVVTVDIETGQIRDWPAGVEPLHLYMKVVDGCCLYLLDDRGQQFASYGPDYVPGFIPGEYGDYVNLKIDASGRVTNWNPNAHDIAAGFFPEQD